MTSLMHSSTRKTRVAQSVVIIYCIAVFRDFVGHHSNLAVTDRQIHISIQTNWASLSCALIREAPVLASSSTTDQLCASTRDLERCCDEQVVRQMILRVRNDGVSALYR